MIFQLIRIKKTEEILFETEQWEKGYDLPIDQDKKRQQKKNAWKLWK